MPGYYDDKLAAERLRQCYEIAPPRVRQYLEAEVQHVLARICPGDRVLELGCGYGRVLLRLAGAAGLATGIDTSAASIAMGQRCLRAHSNCRLAVMDAVVLAFCEASFDAVVCIQNGISAFQVDRRMLMGEALRVTRPEGVVLFSSYAAGFWDARLEWFELQAAHGLLGELDRERTRDGVIVCKDGFRATTVGPEEFAALATSLGARAVIEEVDGSSVFCELTSA
ncbi:MAG: class I SAM-dependent methyltransferase [Phycisphaerales bacterium]|nr:MAG: class I SAM-dependent methyltransferase [Phycisphaerales bacterium]